MRVRELRHFISSLDDEVEVTAEFEGWDRVVWADVDALALQGGKLIICATESEKQNFMAPTPPPSNERQSG